MLIGAEVQKVTGTEPSFEDCRYTTMQRMAHLVQSEQLPKQLNGVRSYVGYLAPIYRVTVKFRGFVDFTICFLALFVLIMTLIMPDTLNR